MIIKKMYNKYIMHTLSLIILRILIEGFIAGILFVIYNAGVMFIEGVQTYVLIRED